VIAPQSFRLQSTTDSLLFQPADSLRIVIEWNSTVTVLFNEQSVTFDGSRFFLKAKRTVSGIDKPPPNPPAPKGLTGKSDAEWHGFEAMIPTYLS
jgi:hypothetical protein